MKRFSLPIIAVLLVACGAGQTAIDSPAGDNPALELRKMILTRVPEPDEPSVVIMDAYVGEAVVSVMSSAGGDASLYYSTGGAMIGGQGHANVRAAAIAFAEEAGRQQKEMQPVTAFPYPAAGMVRFYLRTRASVLVAEAAESELEKGTHPLSPLYTKGWEVVNQFRKVSEAGE